MSVCRATRANTRKPGRVNEGIPSILASHSKIIFQHDCFSLKGKEKTT